MTNIEDQPIFEAKHFNHNFGAVVALQGASLSLNHREVIELLVI